jgi:hypothetical protein
VSALGVFGILLGLLAWPFAFIERSRARAALFALAYLTHVLCAIAYWLYSQTNASDASLYYLDPYGMYVLGFGFSTQSVVWLVQTIKSVFGGTYLDYFFLFQAFGFFGIALLMRIMEEIYIGLDIPQQRWTYLLLFLPGIHFWTSAIGKDAIIFTGCCLAIWASMQVRRRYLALGVAIFLMILVRPHVALITAAVMTWTVFADRSTHILLRGLLVVVSLAAFVFAVATIKTSLYIDVTSADSVTDFLATRDNFVQRGDLGTTGVANAPYPIKVFSFLFRPLFLDANGAFGYVASLENSVLLAVFGAMALRARTLFSAARAVPFVRYALISSIGITLALSIDYYNVGLGLRQKTMVIQGFLIVFVAVSALRQARRRAGEAAQTMRASPLTA